MSWKAGDRENVDIRWSALKFFHDRIVLPRGLDASEALGGLGMSFLPATPRDSNYDILTYDESRRPCLILEPVSGGPIQTPGRFGWRDEYFLTIRSNVYEESGGGKAEGDLELECWIQALRNELRKRRIDLYSFVVPASPVLLKAEAFTADYLGHEWAANEKDPSQNEVVMRVGIER